MITKKRGTKLLSNIYKEMYVSLFSFYSVKIDFFKIYDCVCGKLLGYLLLSCGTMPNEWTTR